MAGAGGMPAGVVAQAFYPAPGRYGQAELCEFEVAKGYMIRLQSQKKSDNP